tara:strand:- start:1666 stop:2415 length:750 start_codon:yes stop_codon:yes gene_type:complete
MSTKEVAVKENKLAVPDYAKKYAGEGASDINSDMIGRTFIKLVQKTSREFDEGKAAVGEWIDSVTGNNYGTEVVVTVVKIQRLWRKFNSSNKLEAESLDGITWDNGKKLGSFVTKDGETREESWACMFMDFFVLVKGGSKFPSIISLSSTGFKAAKDLTTQIVSFTLGDGEPIFLRNYTFYSKEEQNQKGKFAVAKTKLNSGFNSEQELELADKVRKMCENVTAKVDVQEPVVETNAAHQDEEEELELD